MRRERGRGYKAVEYPLFMNTWVLSSPTRKENCEERKIVIDQGADGRFLSSKFFENFGKIMNGEI